jgi:hypothetical protein
MGLSELFAVELRLQPRLYYTSHVMLDELILGLALIVWSIMAIRELLFPLLIDPIKLFLHQILFQLHGLVIILFDNSFIEIIFIGGDISHRFMPEVPIDKSGNIFWRVLDLTYNNR